jgi:hypothetical protein
MIVRHNVHGMEYALAHFAPTRNALECLFCVLRAELSERGISGGNLSGCYPASD